MKPVIVISGANGFLGRAVSRFFLKRGRLVTGLVRNRGGVVPGVKEVEWDALTLGDWVGELEGADLLLNLAGRSVNCRYHARNRAEIMLSRTEATRILGDAVALCANPPRLWINSSTATIYRHAEDRPQGEHDGDLGEGFSVEVAKAWEKAFFGARVPGEVRKVALRTALVLGNEAGTVFDYLWRLARLGLGGRMGTGGQMVSWIHLDDFCRVIAWLIEREEIEGVINAAAPEAVPNRGLMAAMREVAGRPFGLPAGRWMLELGAWALRTETELLLKSRWVIPGRLRAEGFPFRWPDLQGAVSDLALHRNRRRTVTPEKGPLARMKALSRHGS